MKRLIGFEYRKLWNRTGLVALFCLLMLATLYNFVYLGIQRRTLDRNHQMVEGLAAYRTLRDTSRELEGYMDDAYLKRLVQLYQDSDDRQLAEHTGFLYTGGLTPFANPNYLINFAHYGRDMSSGSDKFGLDYDYISSADAFYRQLKWALLDRLEGWTLFSYTPDQWQVLEQKADQLRFPLRVGYMEGWINFNNQYRTLHLVAQLTLPFLLAGLYARNGEGGHQPADPLHRQRETAGSVGPVAGGQSLWDHCLCPLYGGAAVGKRRHRHPGRRFRLPDVLRGNPV